MSITATFPQGVNEITVNGLHQWDYGRGLKIVASDLPATVEVHFAGPGMSEAVVRSCTMVGGSGTVGIPDKCLEQSAPIHAWIYHIDGNEGHTVKTIILPIIPRTQPQPFTTVPQSFTDKYTELITGVNTAIGKLTSGEVTAKNATSSAYATSSGSSTYATSAGHATSSDHAYTADKVTTIIQTLGTNASGKFVATKTGLYACSLSCYNGGKGGQYTSIIYVNDINVGTDGTKSFAEGDHFDCNVWARQKVGGEIVASDDSGNKGAVSLDYVAFIEL